MEDKSHYFLKSLGIYTPKEFPTELHDNVNDYMAKIKDSHLDIWREFAGGWNSIVYRYLTCYQCNKQFTFCVSKYGGSPKQPIRYFQERELFIFYLSGISVIESFCYSFYAINSIYDSIIFPIDTDEQKRNINIKSLLSNLERSKIKDENITISIKNLSQDRNFFEWLKVRNILAHRESPPRRHYLGGEKHGSTEWAESILINYETTTSRFDWLSKQLYRMISDTNELIMKYNNLLI